MAAKWRFFFFLFAREWIFSRVLDAELLGDNLSIQVG